MFINAHTIIRHRLFRGMKMGVQPRPNILRFWNAHRDIVPRSRILLPQIHIGKWTPEGKHGVVGCDMSSVLGKPPGMCPRVRWFWGPAVGAGRDGSMREHGCCVVKPRIKDPARILNSSTIILFHFFRWGR